MSHSCDFPRSGFLLRNLVLFGRLLRRIGIQVTAGQIADLVKALRYLKIGDPRDFKNAARTVLVRRFEDLELFERVFDLFWRARGRSDMLLDPGFPTTRAVHSLPRQSRTRTAVERNRASDSSPQPLAEGTHRTSWSYRERVWHKDFAELTRTELEQVKQLMGSMVWELERRRTRRKIRSPRGRYLDWRCTLRHNLRHGGDPILLRRQSRKRKRRPLVVLCDISGSMEPYSRLLLQFIYAISNGLEKVESFVFSTRLTRVTRSLKERNVDAALRRAADQVEDWAGGTRIGAALKSFNYEWSRRVLRQGAVVLIISDGWDRGDIALLGREMERLSRSTCRLIWLNPLLGSPNYQPLTLGIQAALPHVDDFLPVHNLASLSQLGELLFELGQQPVSARRRDYVPFRSWA